MREVVVVDSDSKRPEVYRLAGNSYVAVAVDRDGWVTAETLRLRFWRQREGAALAVADLDDPTAHAEI